MTTKKRTPASLRMDDELFVKVEKAMEITKLSQAEVLRMALAVGLEDLRRCNFDIPGAIVDKANQSTSNITL